MECMSSFSLQLFTLFHTDAVLLINHHESKLVHVYFFLAQGVGSFDKTPVATANPFMCSGLFGRLETAYQQPYLISIAKRLHEFVDGLGMLPSKQFSRSHKRHLKTLFERHECCHRSYYGLTRTNVT